MTWLLRLLRRLGRQGDDQIDQLLAGKRAVYTFRGYDMTKFRESDARRRRADDLRKAAAKIERQEEDPRGRIIRGGRL